MTPARLIALTSLLLCPYAQCDGFYALARRQQGGFAIAYFDCDEFKQINDRRSRRWRRGADRSGDGRA